jgi:hypothetical protein
MEDEELIAALNKHYGNDNRSWVLHPEDINAKRWYWLVLLTTLYASFYAPTRLCFFPDQVKTSGFWLFRDVLIDVIFIFDIVVNFNTGLLRGRYVRVLTVIICEGSLTIP